MQMNKIINYIKNGQGLGVKYLLIFSVVVAVFFGVGFKLAAPKIIPYAQNLADQILPIKIVDGEIVEPANTFKEVKIFEDNDGTQFNFVLDTNIDVLDTSGLAEGIYLTKSNIYKILDNNSIEVVKLEGNNYFAKQDYTEFFNSIATWSAVVVFFTMIVFLFVACFIFCIFYATCAYALTSILKSQKDFAFRMRVSTICFLTTLIVLNILEWTVAKTSALTFFVAVILLQLLVIKETTKEEANPPKKSINKI